MDDLDTAKIPNPSVKSTYGKRSKAAVPSWMIVISNLDMFFYRVQSTIL